MSLTFLSTCHCPSWVKVRVHCMSSWTVCEQRHLHPTVHEDTGWCALSGKARIRTASSVLHPVSSWTVGCTWLCSHTAQEAIQAQSLEAVSPTQETHWTAEPAGSHIESTHKVRRRDSGGWPSAAATSLLSNYKFHIIRFEVWPDGFVCFYQFLCSPMVGSGVPVQWMPNGIS